jgi:hypothetical protein
MALSNETQTFILSIVDANQEYNSKMTLLFMMLTYSVVMFVFSFWIERRDPRWNWNEPEFLISRGLLNRLFRWMGGAYIFIFLLLFLFMYRAVPFERLLQLVFALYIPLMTAFTAFGVMYAYDVIMDFTGVRSRKFRARKKFFNK